MAEQQGQEKTEAPTEKKRRESREEGQVAFSKELSSAALLAGIVLTLVATSPFILDSFRELMTNIFRQMASADELSVNVSSHQQFMENTCWQNCILGGP